VPLRQFCTIQKSKGEHPAELKSVTIAASIHFKGVPQWLIRLSLQV
jgi:hypothetical protein